MIENPCIYFIPPENPTYGILRPETNDLRPEDRSNLPPLCEFKIPKATGQQVGEDISCHSPNGPCSPEQKKEIIKIASIYTDDYIASYKLKKLLEKLQGVPAKKKRKSLRLRDC
jgi:hypothetical protein